MYLHVVASPIFVGLDVGGSKTELLALTPDHNETVHCTGPGANPMRIGIDAAAQSLADLINKALRQSPNGRVASICAGVAGAGQIDDQERLTERLYRLLDLPASSLIHVVHDAEIALEAAFEAESGVVVIVGTGSVVFARTRDGRTDRTGGWGYILGDEGSGFALGQEGLRAVADAFDNGPNTVLQPWLADRYGLDNRARLIHRVYEEEWPLQKVAPLVIEAAVAGDEVATRITNEQTDRLAAQVEWLIDRCSNLEPRIALTGGLIQDAHYTQALRETLLDRLPEWTVDTVSHRPVTGALHLARRVAA